LTGRRSSRACVKARKDRPSSLRPEWGLSSPSGTPGEHKATYIGPLRNLRIERYQGQTSRVNEGAQVRVSPKVRRCRPAQREGVPQLGKLDRLCPIPNSPVRSQGPIGFPCLVWTHDLLLHDMLVRQQPQKAHLRNAAKCKFVVSKIPEPSARCRVMNVLVRDQSYPQVDVSQVVHQSQNLTDPGFPAVWSGSKAV
jgi:hypothetical protein